MSGTYDSPLIAISTSQDYTITDTASKHASTNIATKSVPNLCNERYIGTYDLPLMAISTSWDQTIADTASTTIAGQDFDHLGRSDTAASCTQE